MNIKRFLALLLTLAILVSFPFFKQTAYALTLEEAREIWMDPAQPIETRVDALIEQMTLAEKVGQTTQLLYGNAGVTASGTSNYVITYFLGSLLWGGSDFASPNSATGWQTAVTNAQAAALKTRLAIPLILQVDAVHGNNKIAGGTIFPHNIGIAAMGTAALGNPTEMAYIDELGVKMGKVTAEEMRAMDIPSTFAPCCATPINPRWGRTYEGWGPDYSIPEWMIPSFIKGLQGGSPSDYSQLNDESHPNVYAYLDNYDTVIACMKHFLGEGLATNGTNKGNMVISGVSGTGKTIPSNGNFAGWTPQDILSIPTFYDLYRPYRAMTEAGARDLMPSYSAVNGKRMHEQKELIDVVKLPKEQGGFGFTGFLISDYNPEADFSGANKQTYYQRMFDAGNDLMMVVEANECTATGTSGGWIPVITSYVGTNTSRVARLDDAVRRILRVKFELGLFENPYNTTSERAALAATVKSADHKAVAREIARKSLVLLKNDNDIVGQLKGKTKILVSGRTANDRGNLVGGWSSQSWQGESGNANSVGNTIYQAISAARGSSNVGLQATGTGTVTGASGPYDVIIYCPGETPYAESNGDAAVNTATARATLQLDATDRTAISNLKTNYPGVPIVMVLVSGRPMIIRDQIDKVDAVIAAWLPGTEGGDAIAEVLFDAAYDFYGKTPYDWSWYPEWIADYSKPAMFKAGFGLKKGETGSPIVRPPMQSAIPEVYLNGASSAFTVSAPYNKYGFLTINTSNQVISPSSSNFGDANWIEYQFNVRQAGAYTFTLNSSAASTNGASWAIDGGTAANFNLANGNVTFTSPALAAGIHTLRVNYNTAGAGARINSLSISSSGTPVAYVSADADSIVAGRPARLPVTVTVSGDKVFLKNSAGTIVSSANVAGGKAVLNLSATDVAAPGTYDLYSSTDGGETAIANTSISVLSETELFWSPYVGTSSNDVYIQFAGDLVSFKSLTVNGIKIPAHIVSGGRILADLADSEILIQGENKFYVEGVKYANYFQDYNFNYRLRFDR